MNFLAHQYLSFGIHPIMVGNFIADSVKGNALNEYDDEVKAGIMLHRFIDSYTDSHLITLQTRERLYPYFGKYAGVVQDVFYDHFLAKNWSQYHQSSLTDFNSLVYEILGKYRSVFNAKADRVYHYMREQDWLGGYATVEGIDRALSGLSRRASFPSNMNKAIPPLIKHNQELEGDFKAFFPQLVEAVKLALDKAGP